mmetsp:Transcript_29992/g.95765  ORF Transcript_29992/g.95765 Transcript_29992/m.95765 type:complete len:292 (-) Transcript_29992:126-1001(-)
MSQDGRRLFVGKLPQDIQEDEIRMIFDTYGRTVDVYLMHPGSQPPGQEYRCAFVMYETSEAAKVAMQALSGVYRFREDAPEPINVSIARPRGSDKNGAGYGDDHSRGYDRWEGYDWGRGYGQGGGYDRGGGYDGGGCYGRSGGYDRAGGCGHGAGYERRGYDRSGYCRAPGYGGARDQARGEAGKGARRGGVAPDPGTRLYVGNLPGDIAHEALDMVFSTYGYVAHIHVMSGRSRSGQACAFVTFSTKAEARAAFSAMQTGYEIRPGEGCILVKYANEPGGAAPGGRFGPY